MFQLSMWGATTTHLAVGTATCCGETARARLLHGGNGIIGLPLFKIRSHSTHYVQFPCHLIHENRKNGIFYLFGHPE